MSAAEKQLSLQTMVGGETAGITGLQDAHAAIEFNMLRKDDSALVLK